MPQFSRFHVLYKENPQPGQKFWQITARPADDGSGYEVRMFGGAVIDTDPNFKVDTHDAEYSKHLTEAAANKEADDERDQRIADGWLLYQGGFSF